MGRFWCYRRSDVDTWLELVAAEASGRTIPHKEIKSLIGQISVADDEAKIVEVLFRAAGTIAVLSGAEQERVSAALQDAIRERRQSND